MLSSLFVLSLSIANAASAYGRRTISSRGLSAYEAASSVPHYSTVHKRALNSSRDAFYVNGSNIPDVNFDIGPSYAGLIPISNATNETRSLYFWYFPMANGTTSSGNATGQDLTIWLNGGPGCSSLEGFLQENGPMTWKWGTYLPVVNDYSWTKLSNMLWVEQPVGTGFSQGVPTATNETDVADQFMGFLEQFFLVFPELQPMDLYVTGESYAGLYIPYIADALHNNTAVNLKGTLINDGVLTDNVYQSEMTTARFVHENAELFNLNQTYMTQLMNASQRCGYEDYLDSYLTYPSNGTMPGFMGNTSCDLWDQAFDATLLVNPCFNIYHINEQCPLLWDVLGFPGSFEYTPAGSTVYFNRTDVQQAINAPQEQWAECTSTDVFVNGTDNSEPVNRAVLPRVIEKNERTVIGQGNWDYIIMSMGTRLAIQNMTWNGTTGFNTMPSTPLVVPGVGTTGIYHEERGLLYYEVNASGHMIPQFDPVSSYVIMQYLLGQIPSLNATDGSSYPAYNAIPSKKRFEYM